MTKIFVNGKALYNKSRLMQSLWAKSKVKAFDRMIAITGCFYKWDYEM
jgi:hypothetical protein